jgi:hypothetical protein
VGGVQHFFLNRTENTETPTFKGIPTDTNNFLHNKDVFTAGIYFQNPVHPSRYSDQIMGWKPRIQNLFPGRDKIFLHCA